MISTDNLAWTYCFHHDSLCTQTQDASLKHSYPCMYQTIRFPNSTTLRILTTVSTSSPVRNNMKNWNVDGKVTLGKLNNRTALYIFTQYLISLTFPNHCEHCYILRLNTVIYCVWTLFYIASEHCYILRLNTVIYCVSKSWENKLFSIQTHTLWSGPHKLNFKLLPQLYGKET